MDQQPKQSKSFYVEYWLSTAQFYLAPKVIIAVLVYHLLYLFVFKCIKVDQPLFTVTPQPQAE